MNLIHPWHKLGPPDDAPPWLAETFFRGHIQFARFVKFRGLSPPSSPGYPPALILPELPHIASLIYKISLWLGLPLTRRSLDHPSLLIRWSTPARATTPPELLRRTSDTPGINLYCTDVRKSRVEQAASAVLGYPLQVNPRTWPALLVQKSEENALHDGFVLQGPLHDPKPGFVYQKLVNNIQERGFVTDWRIPVFRKNIPFVYRKIRPVEDRFSNSNSRSEIVEVHDAFTPEEQAKIFDCCARLNLDYGEIDVLRDYTDGHLYIVDVNPTPSGPPSNLVESEPFQALRRLAAAFASAFLPHGKP